MTPYGDARCGWTANERTSNTIMAFVVNKKNYFFFDNNKHSFVYFIQRDLATLLVSQASKVTDESDDVMRRCRFVQFSL